MAPNVSKAILMPIMALFLMTGTAYAGTTFSGNSILLFNVSSFSVHQGSIAKVTYKLKLVTGNGGATNVELLNSNSLAMQGITVSLTNATKGYYPSYNGSITINAASNATPGQYKLVLAATGVDPTSKNATINFTVIQAAATTPPPTNTVVTNSTPTSKNLSTGASATNQTKKNQTQPSSNVTKPATNQTTQKSTNTTSQKQSSPSSDLGTSGIIVLVIGAMAVIALLVSGSRMMRKQKQA